MIRMLLALLVAREALAFTTRTPDSGTLLAPDEQVHKSASQYANSDSQGTLLGTSVSHEDKKVGTLLGIVGMKRL